jgi:AraC-like DNA-binding protein
MEVVDSLLLISTNTGEVFQYDGQQIKLLFKLSTRVRDIYKFSNTVYFSTDEGVYTIRNMQVISLKRIVNLPFCVMVVVDLYNNTWISTENGLYLLPENRATPILFIEGVEFNRGALLGYEDHIYAGSVEGLYIIDIHSAIKNFLPLYLNKEQVADESWKFFLLVLTGIILAVLAGYILYHKRYRKVSLSIPKKEEPVFSLNKIEEDIKINHIKSVDELAGLYKTNTVQLNRLFKNFETTPGKFMKRVKLNIAKELLKNGVPLEEVVIEVGYSAQYLKKELHI